MILIEGAEAISDAETNMHLWLPHILPSTIRLVISCTHGLHLLHPRLCPPAPWALRPAAVLGLSDWREHAELKSHVWVGTLVTCPYCKLPRVQISHTLTTSTHTLTTPPTPDRNLNPFPPTLPPTPKPKTHSSHPLSPHCSKLRCQGVRCQVVRVSEYLGVRMSGWT